MYILIKSAKIIDPNSSLNGQIRDILIEDGKINKIESGLIAPEGSTIIEKENLHVSIGWFDMHVNFRDPGFEHKEDLISGMRAAAQGGFTGVSVMPSTLPPIHSKTEVQYVVNKSRASIVDVFPVGTITHNQEGKQLSEMYDMHTAGAVAFSDDKKNLANSGLLMRALLYAKNFNSRIISFPQDKTLTEKGMMNEGINSTTLGLKGIPAIAEEIMIQRDLSLCRYTDTTMHFSGVSTKEGLELIRQAKKDGLKVTADTYCYQIANNDSILEDFDTNYKLNPPLRTNSEIEAIKKALQDGTIDALCSDHAPQDIESKNIEFEYSAFGMIGLETSFGIINMYSGLSTDKIINLIAYNPRNILSLKIPEIKVGETANLTLFNPHLDWTFDESNIKSKSKNTPFIGRKLKGKAFAILNNGQLNICS